MVKTKQHRKEENDENADPSSLNSIIQRRTTLSNSKHKPPPFPKISHSNALKPRNSTPTKTGRPRTSTIRNNSHDSAQLPHFQLADDPSFWANHNVQVVVRVRPLNTTEISLHGHNRCLKQDDAHTLLWLGQPPSRFTFDHVACETITQESLFRTIGLPMIENCIAGYNSCIFAYGQTGSGKTHTMLGVIDELEASPSPHRGISPRIFEFLFSRIRGEEVNRRHEKLKYNCKCSFLEIYNEQIWDLLEPSSRNLFLREDTEKGVYVENLTEFVVENVKDVLSILVKGAANRKVAATSMNRESSRSHSVFSCVIESTWHKDSMTNLRYARLNLVDLAGSERQKMSGAEGERLKESASINKSLSTLSHVIMTLADVANGKQRHVPYRDSKLTFLLQDSLGGNSKTAIVANVNPSICCASETLSTLKFSQRAKFIQNNALVNEDAAGDVQALQYQIRLLKAEVSKLEHTNVSRILSFGTTTLQDFEVGGFEVPENNEVLIKQLISLEKSLAGALRRENVADSTNKHLQTEICQLNRLVHQRDEDIKCMKMMLKFHEDKMQRMVDLADGSINKDLYTLKMQNSLHEEIQILRARAERNPEVTRLTLENTRLLDQLRRFQHYYEEGERAQLLAEVSELRNQLLQNPNTKMNHEDPNQKEDTHIKPPTSSKENEHQVELERTYQELEQCRINLKSCMEINEQLTREINGMHSELNNAKIIHNDRCASDELLDMDLSTGSFTIDTINHEEITKNALEDVNAVMDVEIPKKQGVEIMMSKKDASANLNSEHMKCLHPPSSSQCFKHSENNSTLKKKLNQVQLSLDKARTLNMKYKNESEMSSSQEEEMEEIRRQVETETAEVIMCLQDEVCALQQHLCDSNRNEMNSVRHLKSIKSRLNDVEERLHLVTNNNDQLNNLLGEKDKELKSLKKKWEVFACETENLLASGDMIVESAVDEVHPIDDIVSHRDRLREQVKNTMLSKDGLIEKLQISLVDANDSRADLELKLRSLREATLAVTNGQQKSNDDKDREILLLSSELSEKIIIISELKNKIKGQ